MRPWTDPDVSAHLDPKGHAEMNLVELLRAYAEDGGTVTAELIERAERLMAAEPGTTPEDRDPQPGDAMLVFPDGVEPLTDDELAELETALRALGDDDNAPTELILAAADAMGRINAENEARDERVGAELEAREAAIAALRGDDPEAEADGETDPEAADGDSGDGDGGDPPADPPADAGDGEPADDNDREPVVAAGRRAPRSAMAGRRPRTAAQTPAPTQDPDGGDEPAQATIRWAYGVPGVDATRPASGLDEVDRALERRRDTFRHSTMASGAAEWLPVASIVADYPEDRRLLDQGGDMITPGSATARIQSAIRDGIERARSGQNGAPRGMVAAGGLCALPTPLYAVNTYGSTRRPIRDQALVAFQAARGGVTDLTPPVLPDVTGAVSQWTVANDASATSGSPTKPCLRVQCGAQRTTQMYAVPLCLTVGNFLSRTYPELQSAWSDLAMVAHARFAEALLFARLKALSTATTNATTDWSATRDVLAILDQTAAGMRSRHRLDRDFPFIVVLPEVLLTIMRIDISRQMPGGSTLSENLALAEGQVLAWFAARSITPVWTPDVHVIGAQGATALAALPPAIDYIMYPAGTFLFLDGGELDLGVVRDSVNMAVNDFAIFVETFEGVHKVGTESITGSIDVCPSGAVSGTIDPAPWCASYT